MKNNLINRLIKFIASTGLHPNVITVLGLSLGIISCLIFALTHNWMIFSFMLLFSALFDSLDGAIARASSKESSFGGFLDAICDRIYDGCVLIATAYVSGYWLECSILMLTTLCFSYAKARTAIEVSIKNKEWPDLMERGPRSILFFVGLVVFQIYPQFFWGKNILYWNLIALNMLMIISLLQRLFRAHQFIKERS